MGTRIAGLTFAAWFACIPAQADEHARSAGSSEAKSRVDAQVKPIYEPAWPWTHTLEGGAIAGLPTAVGSEVNGGLFEGRFVRFHVGAWTPDGKYAGEHYLVQGQLVLLYETFEYFEAAAPAGEWRNFKRLAAWERHTYVEGGRVVYSESRGRSAPSPVTSAEELQRQAEPFVARLERQRAGS